MNYKIYALENMLHKNEFFEEMWGTFYNYTRKHYTRSRRSQKDML